MDEAWEKAVEAALDGFPDAPASLRTLTLDGAAKCLQGRLPSQSILERFCGLEHLSIANVGASSLERFPRLHHLRRLVLSDNRIASGLEHLVDAGLESLRDLDLSNNRIQLLEDLAPLSRLGIVSLDLYECPVTRIKDYRSRVFGMIRSLRYLDKMDANHIERLESDDEEEDDGEEEDDEDPVSGEIVGEEVMVLDAAASGSCRIVRDEGIIDADDDGSDEDGEEIDSGPVGPRVDGFGRPSASEEVVSDDGDDYVEDEDDEGDEEVDLGEESDGDDDENDDDVVEVHEIEDSDDEDVVEDDDDEEEEDLEDDGDEDPCSTGREVEIDGHEQGDDNDDDDEDEDDEIGEDDGLRVEEEDEGGDCEDEDDDSDEYLVQPIARFEDVAGGDEFEAFDEDDSEDEDEVDDNEGQTSNSVLLPPSSQSNKRKRGRDDDDDDGVDDSSSRSPKHR